MADNKSPLEQALDLLVYAPLGLALTAQEELPKLVEKGRSRVSGQMMMAKMIGQFAVQTGQKEAERQVKKAVERLGDLGVRPPNIPSPSPAPATAPAVATTAPPEAAAGTEAAAAASPPAAAAAAASGASAPASSKTAAKPQQGRRQQANPQQAAVSTNRATNGSTNGGGVPSVDTLAIPGYDSLSAGQVVQRLAGLSGDELDAVARYETATRHRKTILSRVSQLQNAG